MRLGVVHALGGRALPEQQGDGGVELGTTATFDRGGCPGSGPRQRDDRHGRHQRVRAGDALRPDRLDRDDGARPQSPRIVPTTAGMGERRWLRLRPRVRPS